MVKKTYPEAMQRIFHRVYVCKVCKAKIRAEPGLIRLGKVKCRKCGSHALRPKKKPSVK